MSSEDIGILFSDYEINTEDKPFEENSLNEDYRTYSKMGEDKGLEILLASYKWYSDGRLEKAWKYDDGWKLVEDIEISGVFDKFKFDEKTHRLKEKIGEQVDILNDPELEELCKDKLLTYRKFEEYMPETRKASSENVEELLDKNEKVVLKPRYGFEGRGVRIIDNLSDFEEEEDLLVQEFVEPGSIEEHGIEGPHDFRVVLADDKPAEAYFRVPREGLVANVAQGGKIIYVDLEDIPNSVMEIIDQVQEEVSHYRPNFYSVDFMFDKSQKPSIVELNSKPGIGFHSKVEKEQYEEPAMESLVDVMKELI